MAEAGPLDETLSPHAMALPAPAGWDLYNQSGISIRKVMV
jgi:hypothetical protein